MSDMLYMIMTQKCEINESFPPHLSKFSLFQFSESLLSHFCTLPLAMFLNVCHLLSYFCF